MNEHQESGYRSMGLGLPNMESFMQSIKEAIYDVTREKLLKNIEITMQQYKEKSKETYHDRLQLLQAMKPFVHEQAADNIDQITDVFGDMQALKMFVNQHMDTGNDNTYEASDVEDETRIVDREGDLIIEDNTIYEIDKSCKPKITAQSMAGNKENIAAMMLLMLSKNK